MSLKRKTPLRRRKPIRTKRGKPRKSARVRDPLYMAWVREQPCAVSDWMDDAHEGRIHAHHAGPRPYGRKASDYTCIPLCDKHHRAWHDLGWPFRALHWTERRTWALSTIQTTQEAYQRAQVRQLEGIPL